MDFSLNRDKKNTAEMLPFNLLIKIANATLWIMTLPFKIQTKEFPKTQVINPNNNHRVPNDSPKKNTGYPIILTMAGCTLRKIL